jgi:hypothetical protein
MGSKVFARLAQRLCEYDPHHIGTIITDAVELTTLVVILVMVLRLVRKMRVMQNQMKETQLDDK